jgi:hypothetical protein
MKIKTHSHNIYPKREPPAGHDFTKYSWNQVFGYCRPYVLILLLLPLLSGCYHYRVVAPDPEPATEYENRVVHSLFWGLLQAKDISAVDCLSNAIDEVRVTTNLGYSVISVATVGVWTPMNLQWRCAKEPIQEGEI